MAPPPRSTDREKRASSRIFHSRCARFRKKMRRRIAFANAVKLVDLLVDLWPKRKGIRDEMASRKCQSDEEGRQEGRSAINSFYAR